MVDLLQYLGLAGPQAETTDLRWKPTTFRIPARWPTETRSSASYATRTA